jgi:transcriptional regulator with XRE-family HTH domain
VTTGLPDDGRLRRVPGLRREELAQLAHVSVDYVIRLEQGRTRRVSRSILDALADALRLAADERDYLLTVADISPAPTRRPGRADVAPRLRQLLDTMPDIPAMVLNRRMDVLAWNHASAALLTDFAALVGRPRRPQGRIPAHRSPSPGRNLTRPTSGRRVPRATMTRTIMLGAAVPEGRGRS